jgi:hypothetical protein
MLCGVAPNVRKFLLEDFLASESLENLFIIILLLILKIRLWVLPFVYKQLKLTRSI